MTHRYRDTMVVVILIKGWKNLLSQPSSASVLIELRRILAKAGDEVK